MSVITAPASGDWTCSLTTAVLSLRASGPQLAQERQAAPADAVPHAAKKAEAGAHQPPNSFEAATSAGPEGVILC